MVEKLASLTLGRVDIELGEARVHPLVAGCLQEGKNMTLLSEFKEINKTEINQLIEELKSISF